MLTMIGLMFMAEAPISLSIVDAEKALRKGRMRS